MKTRLERSTVILIALFSLGLIIRLAIIGTWESPDFSSAFLKWGMNTYEKGLSVSFEGSYFPIQYLVFAFAYGIAKFLSISTVLVIRIFSSLFEIGSLILLIKILAKYISTKKILTYYWLNPFALIIYQQGYVDPQFSFFVLSTMAILLGVNNKYKYLLAGIPMGIALMMKPQVVPMYIGLSIIFAILFILKYRDDSKKVLKMFVAPFIIYFIFSLYFALTIDINNNHKTLTRVSNIVHTYTHIPQRASDITANMLSLTSQYAYIPNIMSAINAQMANPWFFVAESMRKDPMPIYRVHDTDKFIGLTFRTWGLALLLLALAYFTKKIVSSNQTLEKKIIMTICLVPILVPYLTTNSHENHFFFGFVSTIILGAMLADKFILNSGYLLAILNGLNILYWYIIPHYFHIIYTNAAKMSIIGASSIIFFALIYHLIFKVNFDSNSDPSKAY